MKSALAKDRIRTIRKGKKRFLSIKLITALGVTMLTGVRAACTDLRYSADALFDKQKLFDIQISSTLGLDKNELEALGNLDDVSAVEGEYSKTVSTSVSGLHEDVRVRTIGQKINLPTVIDGTLPQSADEAAVTRAYLHAIGKRIGDTVSVSENDLEDGEDPILKNTEYKITGEVLDPFDVNNKDGHVSFRSEATTKYTFFVTSDAVDSDIYTAIYVSVQDAEKLMCYSDVCDTTEWEKLHFIARWMQEVKALAKGSDEEYLIIFGNCFNSKTRADYDSFDYRGYLYNRQTQRFDRI